jgi:hypothetical protein
MLTTRHPVDMLARQGRLETDTPAEGWYHG